MGFFSSKKTFSGVGSAVQNLHNGPIESMLTTTVVSAQINEKDLGESFKNTLASGTGLKLRSFIDYAHQKGYTNTLGWEVTKLEGDVFSDSSAYINYLSKYVYPSSSAEVDTPKTSTKTLISESSYINGNETVTTKSYKKIEKYTRTITTTNYSFDVNFYYQGSNSTYINVWKLFNNPKYAELANNIKETAEVFCNDVYFAEKYKHGWGFYETVATPNVTVVLLNSDSSVKPTVSGTTFCSVKPILEQTFIRSFWNDPPDGGGSAGWEEESLKNYVLLAEEPNAKGSSWSFGDEITYPIYTDVIADPVNTLHLTGSVDSVNIVKTVFLVSSTTVDLEPDPDATSHYDGVGNFFHCKALIMYTPGIDAANGKKVLVSNITVRKTIDKTTSNVTTEYLVTEKYINGKLISSNEIEGASTTDSKVENLETSSTTHEDSYVFGSGNTLLDSIINNTHKFTESFCPTLPVKTWGELCSPSWGNLYTAERKLYRKLTGKTLNKWDLFVKSFKNVGDDAKMVYYFLGIPINVDDDFANEYFFHFFKWISVNFGGMFTAYDDGIYFSLLAKSHTDFHVTYNFRVNHKVIKGKVPIPCKTHGYARYIVLGDEPEDMTTKSWQGGFGPTAGEGYWFTFNRLRHDAVKKDSVKVDLVRENYPNLTDEQFQQLQNSATTTVVTSRNGTPTSLTLYYKVNEELYERVYVTNFVFSHLVRSTALIYYLKASLRRDWKTAIDDDGTNDKNAGFAPIVIPLAKGALESMGWYRQSNISDLCHNIIISGYDQQTVKTKWYQSGFFLFVLIVVIAIVCVVTAGAGSAAAGGVSGAAGSASAGGAAAAGGATVGATATSLTISSLAMYAMQAITIALVAKAITYVANKFIGGIFGQIIGTVASIVATVYLSYTFGWFGAGTNSFWEAMNTWKGYMTLSKSLITETSSTLNNINQERTALVQGQYAELISDQQNKSTELTDKMLKLSSLENNNITDIIVNSTYTTSSTTTNSTSQFIAEDPDTFFYRVFDLDFYDLNKSYISDFEDYQNNIELPC